MSTSQWKSYTNILRGENAFVQIKSRKLRVGFRTQSWLLWVTNQIQIFTAESKVPTFMCLHVHVRVCENFWGCSFKKNDSISQPVPQNHVCLLLSEQRRKSDDSVIEWQIGAGRRGMDGVNKTLDFNTGDCCLFPVFYWLSTIFKKKKKARSRWFPKLN